jgi:hypothetical protein
MDPTQLFNIPLFHQFVFDRVWKLSIGEMALGFLKCCFTTSLLSHQRLIRKKQWLIYG